MASVCLFTQDSTHPNDTLDKKVVQTNTRAEILDASNMRKEDIDNFLMPRHQSVQVGAGSAALPESSKQMKRDSGSVELDGGSGLKVDTFARMSSGGDDMFERASDEPLSGAAAGHG